MSSSPAASTYCYSTLSNYSDIKAHHMHLELDVDFETKKLTGSVTYTVKEPFTKFVSQSSESSDSESDKLKQFVCDTKDLVIKEVYTNGYKASYKLIPDPKGVFGSALHIDLEEVYKLQYSNSNDPSTFTSESVPDLEIKISYSTSPDASACQWLAPSNTHGKKYPYLFTQCQAIHCRSLLPVQDTPATKYTYTAKIVAPSWSTALMSAIMVGKGVEVENDKKMFTFEQKVPVPSYLIALVVGQLEARQVSHRCSIYSEPGEPIEKAHYEFSESEEFLQIAEEITGLEYQWGRYDVVSLPPSFPFGGMENPCLTFVTPTLLAGDRSLADVVAHEIAHSWTGNVVTNLTWTHFWLNEGWTVWLERKIKEEKAKKKYLLLNKETMNLTGLSDPKVLNRGKECHAVASLVGLAHLEESCSHFEKSGVEDYSKMVPDLSGGIDPDDVFSSVPYEKGCSLLHVIEHYVNGTLNPNLNGNGNGPGPNGPNNGTNNGANSSSNYFIDEFVRPYIQRFKFKTVTAQLFKEFSIEKFPQLGQLINWDEWYYGLGSQHVINSIDRAGCTHTCNDIDDARKCAEAWSNCVGASDTSHAESLSIPPWKNDWGTEVKLVFLEKLAKGETLQKVIKNWNLDIVKKFELAHGLNDTQNCEILFLWFTLLLKTRLYKEDTTNKYFNEIKKLMTIQGRMKFTRPLYRMMKEADVEKARAIFEENKNFYHPICRAMVGKDLA